MNQIKVRCRDGPLGARCPGTDACHTLNPPRNASGPRPIPRIYHEVENPPGVGKSGDAVNLAVSRRTHAPVWRIVQDRSPVRLASCKRGYINMTKYGGKV